MKIVISFVTTVSLILQCTETAPTNGELLAIGEEEINELEGAKNILMFDLYIPLLDAMKKIYDISLFAEEIGATSFSCLTVSQSEVKLKPFNSILSSFLYKTEMETIEETKLPITNSKEFFTFEMPLYIRIIDKFLKFLPVSRKEMANVDDIPTIIEGAKIFANGLYSNTEYIDQARACNAMIARIEKNRELFELYLSCTRAILSEVFEKVGRKIARNPKSALSVTNKLKSPKKILKQIENYRVFAEPIGEIYELENNDRELEEEINDDIQRRWSFDFKNIATTAITASALTAIVMSALKAYQAATGNE